MKFTIDSTTEQVESTGGIALAAKISKKIGLNFPNNELRQQLVYSEIPKIIYSLFVQGRSRFEEIKLWDHDPWSSVYSRLYETFCNL